MCQGFTSAGLKFRQVMGAQHLVGSKERPPTGPGCNLETDLRGSSPCPLLRALSSRWVAKLAAGALPSLSEAEVGGQDVVIHLPSTL